MRSAVRLWLVRAAVLVGLGACWLVLAAAGSSAPARIVLTVTPRDALLDQPVAITVSGLRPRSTVTLRATTRSALGNLWSSTGTFRADAVGKVLVSRSAPLGGSYRGRDGMGLFWSMRWNSCQVCEMQPAPVSTIHIAASQGGRTLATTSVTRRTQTADVTVRTTTLAGEGFVGCYYSSSARPARPRPAILFLGGSSGGLPCSFRTSLLASHDYPTLVLAYFGVPGLPSELKHIPLEYFRSALRWLAQQPGVDPDKLVVYGISRGGEGALLLGSVYPELIHAVVSYVGSSVAGVSYPSGDAAAWTLAGEPVPFTNPENVIRVERIAGPIFLVAGVDDLLWPSAIYASQIVERLRQHQRSDYTSLVYERAGHLVGTAVPYVPLVDVSFGGTAAADARARADSWPKLLAFLERLH